MQWVTVSLDSPLMIDRHGNTGALPLLHWLCDWNYSDGATTERRQDNIKSADKNMLSLGRVISYFMGPVAPENAPGKARGEQFG